MKKYLVGSILLLAGCTPGSLKTAIQTSNEIEARQDMVVSQMAHNLKVYQYNELKTKIKANQADDAYLSDLWNQRNGLESYMIEWERIRALRYLTVDTYLYANQSQIDLHYKSMKEWFNADKNNGTLTSTPVE